QLNTATTLLRRLIDMDNKQHTKLEKIYALDAADSGSPWDRYEFFLDRDNSWNDCVSAMQVFNYMHAVRRNPDAPPLSNKEKTCERTENEYKHIKPGYPS